MANRMTRRTPDHNAERASEDRFLADVLPVDYPIRPRFVRPIPPAVLDRIYAEDRRFNAVWTGATNAEVLIYAGGLAVLIIGVAVWFA